MTENDIQENYQEFTQEIIKEWENSVTENPEIKYNHQKVSDFLPFIKAVQPRIGKKQSLFGLSLICLEGDYPNVEEIVAQGLEPLIKAGILAGEEASQIKDWYKKTEPTWDTNYNNPSPFEKTFEIEGKKYKLYTSCDRCFRDLNLQVVTER